MNEELTELRRLLDEVDRRLVSGLAKRQDIVERVSALKGGSNRSVRDVGREEELLGRLVEVAKDEGLDPFFVTRLFREILDHSVRRQQERAAHRGDKDRPLLVGYQGAEGSYSHMAGMRHFEVRSQPVSLRGFGSFKSLLTTLHDGDLDYAVLPIENTTAGSINESYDLLAQMDLALVGEEVQRVQHCLIALQEIEPQQIRCVYSHPQALAQCREFLSELKECRVEAYPDTALAVAHVKELGDPTHAAIASEVAARLYDLPIIARDIADQRENFTRMVIVARRPVDFDLRVPCKTSLIFATRHEKGALARCIQTFADHSLNLTKLESRPRRGSPFEYLFYLDFEGNLADPNVGEALSELSRDTSYVKVLGSYPSRTTAEAKPASPRLPRPGPRDASFSTSLPASTNGSSARSAEIRVGDVIVGGPSPVVVAAVDAEGAELVERAARLKELGVSILHAPFSEGLVRARAEIGIATCAPVEAPNEIAPIAQHVSMIHVAASQMRHGALIDALGKVDCVVMLERDPMASIDDWLAMAERLVAHGNQQVVLCDGGAFSLEHPTRSVLDLAAIPRLRGRARLPFLVAPLRTVERSEWVGPVTRAAIAAGADGAFLELGGDASAQGLNDEALASLVGSLAR